jgi:hypothetical protein
VTSFSELQNGKWQQCDGFCNIKTDCLKKRKKSHKKSQKKLTKTRLLKLSKTSRIVTAFSRQNTESQMVTIVTVTMRDLGSLLL